MAKKTSSGESKQGLIISLVIFVILTIALGVTTYLGYSGQTDLQAKADDAGKAEKAAKDNRDWYQFQAAAYRDYMGYPATTGEDANALEKLSQRFPRANPPADQDKAGEVRKLMEALDGTLGFDQNRHKALKTFKDELNRLNTELANARQELEETRRALKKDKENHDSQIATKEQEVREWQKKYEGAQAANLKDHQTQEEDFARKLDLFGDLNKQVGDLKRKADEDAGQAEKKAKAKETEIKTLRGIQRNLEEKLTPPDLLKFTEPKGKVVRLDPKGEVAWINVGSADNIRPNQDLTFSVFGAGQGGKADNIRKGAIQVVDIVAPHLSMAKITEVVDPGHYPIVTGDLLINPAWNPQARQHVAIAGFIDLTGDGRDNLEEFMTNLRKQGMIIDAWLDPSDHKTQRGDGITLETNYLILGSQPEISDREKIKGADDPTIASKSEIFDAVGKMQREALDKGVTVVPLQKFVAMTGYRLPKGAGVTTGFGFEGRTKKVYSTAPQTEKKTKQQEPKEDSDK
jgi:hypothetical protein